MYFRHASLKASETPTSECVVTPSHKHTMRQFFSYSDNDTDDKINCHRAQDDFLLCVAKNFNSLPTLSNAPKKWRSTTRIEVDRPTNILNNVTSECVIIF